MYQSDSAVVFGIVATRAPRTMSQTRDCIGSLLIAIAVAAMPWLSAPARAEAQAVHVIEMFTSQGCSSCPPADRLLKTFAGRSDVIALSFHVDYWDRLGWKDTFGNAAFTKRQRDYALRRGDGQVYTPQAIINGGRHEVGSDRSAIERTMSASAASIAAQRLRIGMSMTDGKLMVAISDTPGSSAAGAVVTLLGVQAQGAVTATRGENAGERLAYSNIVRAVKPLGAWVGQRFEASVAGNDATLTGADSAVVLVQRSADGPIIAAAKLQLK
jgi:hypothetical protein